MAYTVRGGLAKNRAINQTGEILSTITHFTPDEARSLIKLYNALTEIGKLDRLRFRDFLYSCFDISTDLMLDLTFRAFDRDLIQVLEAKDFVQGLSIVLRGSRDELIEFCYSAYDMNGDKSLGREELFQCLKGCLAPGYGMDAEDIEDGERDIVEQLLKKLDVNRDGQITYDDFMYAVQSDPLLLQSLGQCLPNANTMAVFLATFTENYRSYHSDWATMISSRGARQRSSKSRANASISSNS